jgi:hypothetical protein
MYGNSDWALGVDAGMKSDIEEENMGDSRRFVSKFDCVSWFDVLNPLFMCISWSFFLFDFWLCT